MSHCPINMTQALASPAYAKTLWINYYKGGNTYGITAEEIGQIEAQWQGKLASWKASVATDDNKYIIDDTSWDNAVADGKQEGRDLTGYEDTTAQSALHCANVGKDVLLSAGNGVVRIAAKEGMKKGGKFILEKATGKTLNEAGGKSAGVIVACALDLAFAGLYKLQNPNKKQYDAIMQINEDLPNQQEKTMEVQNNLTTMDDELMTYTDDANLHVEDANVTMAETKTEYDFYQQFIENVEHKKTAGEEIDKETADMYKEAVEHMTESGENVQMTQEEGTEAVNEIYDTMSEYQEGFDESAKNAAEVQGVTDYVEGFDEATKSGCKIEGAVQYVNAGLSAIDACKAGAEAVATGWCGLGVAYGVAAAAAAAAGVMDYSAGKEQFGMADAIGGEIKNRKDTQDMNDATMEEYDENVDNYALYMEDVEGLEMEVPDDVEAPEGEVPAVAPAEQEKSTENTEDKEDDKVKETKNKKNTK